MLRLYRGRGQFLRRCAVLTAGLEPGRQTAQNRGTVFESFATRVDPFSHRQTPTAAHISVTSSATQGVASEKVVTLSIIVPLGPGEQAWRDLLPQLAACGGDSEILLVHTGTEVDIADPALPGVRQIASAQGRARQLNAGARAARGRWLWFLHADSHLSEDALPRLRKLVDTNVEALGYFDLRFADDGPRLTQLNALGANLRSRWLGLPFGDQGLVLRADTFQGLGGYDETLSSGEDHQLVWRVRTIGIPLCRLSASIKTSARKYRQQGWLSTTFDHLRLTARQAKQARRFRGG